MTNDNDSFVFEFLKFILLLQNFFFYSLNYIYIFLSEELCLHICAALHLNIDHLYLDNSHFNVRIIQESECILNYKYIPKQRQSNARINTQGS